MSSFDSAASQAALNEALWSPPQDVRAGGVHPTPRRQSVRGVDAHKPRGSSARTGTIRSSVFNLTNTILGSGTLAMPYACKLCGVGVFITLIVLTALLADYAIRVLFLAVERMRVLRPRYTACIFVAAARSSSLLSRALRSRMTTRAI